MAIEAVGDVVIRKLNDLLIHDSIAFDNVIDQIEDIRIQLRNMRGFLIGAELSADDVAVAWATEYLRVLFSAEDEIEKYVLSLSASGRRNIGFFQRRGFTLFAVIYDSCGPGRLLRRKLGDLAVEIKMLKGQKPDQVVDASLHAEADASPSPSPSPSASASASVFERWLGDNLDSPLGSPSPRASRSPRSSTGRRHPKLINTHPDQEGPTLIGFNEHWTLLVRRLKGEIQGGRGGVIPLVGLPGSGKTTLVRTIYDLREIKEHFKCRAWIHLPDESITISQLLDNLLQQVLKSKEGGIPNAEHLITRVHESLKEKTYLVVLDHVSDVKLWGEIKSAFPNLSTGESKVILITRDQKVATSSISEQEKHRPHSLDKLGDEHSWELLTKKADLDQQSSQPDDRLRNEILKKCKGCPLDIVLLGGLLSTKGPSCDEWNWYISQANWRRVEIWRLSYNDLPGHAKLCLLYMALFPNEMDISVRRLHRLWLAEGFIRRSPGKSEEDTVEECFDDLRRRNLINISKFKSDGSPKRCHLSRRLREDLSPKAHQIRLFYIHQDSESTHPTHMESESTHPTHMESESTHPTYQESKSTHSMLHVRRVVEYVDIKKHRPDPTSASLSYGNVRSYLSFNFQRNDTPAKEVGNFISKIIGNKGYGVLRVLDLEGVYKPTLPETLKQLFHLRYLGLRWTFIDQLPKSVGDLPYLETLDLKRTYISNLPSSIWKLEHLRHLNLPGICLDYKQKKGHSSLTELRTLVGLIVDDGSTVEELSQLHELRELGVTCQLSSPKDLISLSSWIQTLTNLKFLGLKSKDKMGQPSKIDLLSLSGLSQLSHVSLLGTIWRLPALNEFPPNLKVLALSVSRLNDDPMTILSKLPSLSVLRLLANSYLGTEMECPKNGFKKLRVLKLWMLEKLEEWTVGKGGMPLLKELNIRKCLNLKQLPNQLLNQESLEELTLTSMPKGFVDQVKQEKQSHTVLIVNDYKFTPLPWEKDPELWTSLEADSNSNGAAN